VNSQAVRRTLAATACVFLYSGSLSAATEPVIPPAYVTVAREVGVPPRLLYAVALTESARRFRTNEVRPWPWSLHVNGRAEYHASREDAYRAIRRHLAAGRRSIDIGLMQLNWRWHRESLRDPWQALDPYHNLRTGAHLLRAHYRECGDWLTAAGRYHAPATTKQGRALAKTYRKRVARQLAWLSRQG
jgi:soluble lytic murein transglycosylase-like protein